MSLKEGVQNGKFETLHQGTARPRFQNLRPRLKPVYVSEPETLLLKKPEPETLKGQKFRGNGINKAK